MPFYDRIDFTVSRVTARSYLDRIDPAVRDLARECAEAFIKAAREARGLPAPRFGRDGNDDGA